MSDLITHNHNDDGIDRRGCHGDDARGEEGPSLFNLTLSDTSIAKRIKEGIKGEMPSFAKKFDDADIQALIAYLHTLKD